MTLVWRPGFQFDADASTYIEAVEAADTQALETGVRYAINDFVIGCKQDGIWDAIKACNILAGARTLNGALVPLVKQPADSAPARFGTEGGWNYNRETGLQGNGTDNYINSGRNNNADPQNSKHLAVYATARSSTTNSGFIGVPVISSGGSWLTFSSFPPSPLLVRLNASSSSGDISEASVPASNVLLGGNRSSSTVQQVIAGGSIVSYTQASFAPASQNIHVFQGASTVLNTSRLAFYSIGESLDLALLDTRVSALITAIGAAIP